MDGLVRALVGAVAAEGVRAIWRNEKDLKDEQTYIWVDSKDWPGWKQLWTVAEARRRGYDV